MAEDGLASQRQAVQGVGLLRWGRLRNREIIQSKTITVKKDEMLIPVTSPPA